MDGKLHMMFLLSGNAVTAFAMATAELCACVMRPASTNIHTFAPLDSSSTIIQPAVCLVGFIVNNIPFFTLNVSIVLLMIVQMVTMVFFEFSSPLWLNISAVITSL